MMRGRKQHSHRKFHVERLVGRYLANPVVAGLNRIGVRTTLATELETSGRKTGQRRRVPVAAASRSLQSAPISVRIEFTHDHSDDAEASR